MYTHNSVIILNNNKKIMQWLYNGGSDSHSYLVGDMVSEYITQILIGERSCTDMELTDNYSKARFRKYIIVWQRL